SKQQRVEASAACEGLCIRFAMLTKTATRNAYNLIGSDIPNRSTFLQREKLKEWLTVGRPLAAAVVTFGKPTCHALSQRESLGDSAWNNSDTDYAHRLAL